MKLEDIQRNLDECKIIGHHLILMNKLLGKGHYGKVYLAYEMSKDGEKRIILDKPLACKIIERKELSSSA